MSNEQESMSALEIANLQAFEFRIKVALALRLIEAKPPDIDPVDFVELVRDQFGLQTPPLTLYAQLKNVYDSRIRPLSLPRLPSSDQWCASIQRWLQETSPLNVDAKIDFAVNILILLSASDDCDCSTFAIIRQTTSRLILFLVNETDRALVPDDNILLAAQLIANIVSLNRMHFAKYELMQQIAELVSVCVHCCSIHDCCCHSGILISLSSSDALLQMVCETLLVQMEIHIDEQEVFTYDGIERILHGWIRMGIPRS
ncbi:hypothetical protein ACOME3_000132 [Neoechinorhynchus agilis]